MSDRFYDRHDNSYDSYEDEYEDRYYGSRLSRSGYGDSRSARRNSSSEASRSGRSSGAAGRSYQGSADYRLSQSSDARYTGAPSGASNMFDDYYSDEDIDAYRRSAYGTGSAYSRSSSRRSAQGLEDSDAPSRQRSAQRGASSASRRPAAVPAERAAAHSRASRPSSRNASRVPGRAAEAAGYAPRRSNRKRNLIIAGVVAVVVVLMGVGMAFAYVNSISANLHEGVDDEVYEALTPTSLDGDPFYMLLLGIDTSADRVMYEEDGDTVRSDSMILARIDPQNKKVALVSIHRDTVVDLGEYGEQKINAAYQFNGAAGAIEAVSKMAGVDIAHYASIDFDAFREMVDALGGVEVEVPMEIDDEMAGGHLDAGLQTLNGEQALILARARHAYDDVASDGDVMRAANQRVVISAIVKKILSADVMTIASTVEALSRYVTTDLELGDIIGLAQLMKGLDPSTDIYTAMEPTTSAYIDETWYEFLDEDEWRKMVARMDQGLPPVEATVIDDTTGTVMSTAGTGSTAGNSVHAPVQSAAPSYDEDEYDDDGEYYDDEYYDEDYDG